MKKTLYILIIFMLAGCTASRKPVPVYNTDQIKEHVTIRLTDIFNKIRIIPLETHPDYLVHAYYGNYKIIANDTYIITAANNAIHQFDAATGKHIRRLASAGNGPNEYQDFKSAAIDNTRNILYIQYFGNLEKILAVDLETGAFLPSIPVSYLSADLQAIADKGSLCTADRKFICSEIDTDSGKRLPIPDTNYINRLREAERPAFLSQMGKTNLVQSGKDLFLFAQKISDTVYKYDPAGKKLKGMFGLSSHRTYTPDSGILFDLSFVTPQDFYCGRTFMEVKRIDGRYAFNISQEGFYQISRQNGSIRIIDTVVFNPLFEVAQTGNKSNIFTGENVFRSNNLYVTAWDANIVKEIIAGNLKKTTLAEPLRCSLQELDTQIIPDGNPVIVMCNITAPQP